MRILHDAFSLFIFRMVFLALLVGALVGNGSTWPRYSLPIAFGLISIGAFLNGSQALFRKVSRQASSTFFGLGFAVFVAGAILEWIITTGL